MLSRISSLSTRELAITELPTFGVSLVIAEVAYKFHSFTLEVLAFLATWLLLAAVVRAILRIGRGPEPR